MIHYCFDSSIEELMKGGSEPPKKWHSKCHEREWNHLTGYRGYTPNVIEEWHGSHKQDANELTRNMDSMMLSNELYKNKFAFTRKQTIGTMVDIDRYLAGDERCWFTMKRKPKKVRAVKVYAPIGGLGDVDKHEMLVCGALASAVTEILEAQGIAVELWCGCAYKDCWKAEADYCVNLIKIKDSSEYSDLGMIAYVCGNELVYRNIVWKRRIAFADELSGQGINVTYNPDEYRSYSLNKDLMMPEPEGVESIIVPRIYDIKEAAEWLKKNIEGGENE